jgi:hypothetical protein
MEGGNHDALASGAGEMSASQGVEVLSADREGSSDGRWRPAESNAAGLNVEGNPEESSTEDEQKRKATMVLPEQEGLESLLRSMLTALQRIESLLEGKQNVPGPEQTSVPDDNGKEEDATDDAVMASQQEARRVRKQC